MPSLNTDISLEPLLNADLLIRPLRGYQISDQAVNPGATSYYGFLRNNGAWYVMRSVVSGNVTAYTYVAGDSGYDFSNRAAESYVSFDSAF